MKLFLQKLFLAALMGVVVNACVKQPETIVINKNPETPDTLNAPEDTAASEAASAGFRQLIIGEIHPVSTLDPLFAGNNSAKRMLHILHEGLARYDHSGNVIPAISENWSISADSLTYTFTLRDNVFFHDSNIFDNGLGRKVIASDVTYAFVRMAKIGVPDDAARLFMSIDGFEPYFNEQHQILNPAHRELVEISGIKTPDDNTVIFALIEKDHHFLQKLASPYAVIYPREAVGASPQNFSPVGAGPFELSRQRGDSIYIFARNNEYWDNSVPGLDRVDVVIETNESRMFQALASGNIHLIPELGPQIILNSLADGIRLLPAYTENYTLTVPGGVTTYRISYYEEADASEQAVRAAFSSLTVSQLIEDMPEGIVNINTVRQSNTSASPGLSSTLYSTYTEDPFQKWMLAQISARLNGDKQLIRMLRIRTPGRNTALYNRSFVSLYPGHKPADNPSILMSYSIKQTALSINEIQRLRFNRYPWWMDLRNVTLPGIDQL